MINIFSKWFKKDNNKERPIIVFKVKKNNLNYVIEISNNGNADAIVNKIKCSYNKLPFTMRPKIEATLNLIIHSKEKITLDMPSMFGSNFIEALLNFDFQYAMPKLIMYYTDNYKHKYTAEYYFVGKEEL